MSPTDVLKPLGVFALVVAVILAGTAVVSIVAGGGSAPAADGRNVDGQSPPHYQPDAVNVDADPETGELSVDASDGPKQILIDVQHGNTVARSSLEPIVEALTEAGHDVDFGASTDSSDGGGFGAGGYNATLQRYDAVIVVNPTQGFTETERAGLRAYTENDGRLLVLGEPTQLAVGGGLLGSVSVVSFAAGDLTGEYGAHMGSEGLYNIDDEANDNNFKAVNAEPAGSSTLGEGVDTITFEHPGYIVTTGDSDAEVLFAAADGTKTLETRRDGTYATVVRNGNMVFVADSDFLDKNEVYDADNEVFISNLLEFLTSGDKPDDVPETGGATPGGGGF